LTPKLGLRSRPAHHGPLEPYAGAISVVSSLVIHVARLDMLYRITSEAGYLRADLFHRETAEESREFFAAVAEAAQRRGCTSILISVHASSPLFTVDRSGFFAEFALLDSDPHRKVALVADDEELDYSHEYFALLAQHQGLNVSHFRNEVAALDWLQPRSLEIEREGDGQRSHS
jgi:hypothetical protein